MLRACFDVMHKNLFKKRTRKIAIGGYGMMIIRKAFTCLKENTLQAQIY